MKNLEGKGQLIRLGMAQADGEAALWVSVDQQHFLPVLRQSDPQVCAGSRLANATFLVGNGDNLRVQRLHFISDWSYHVPAQQFWKWQKPPLKEVTASP